MSERLATKVLLIGWDAADWKIIRPLLDSGQMPNLRRLIDEGASGKLASLQPMLSPMLWTSIATGKRPHKHGIHGFTEPQPDGRGIRAVTSTSRTTKAIWNILTQNGFRTHNIAWYASHPAEPVNGVSVSNHYNVVPQPGVDWKLSDGAIYPPELSDAIAQLRVRPEAIRLADLRAFIPNAMQIAQTRDERLVKCAVILAETANTHAAATWVLQHQPWDFMAVLYDSIDHFSHTFMEYHPPKQSHVSDEEFARYQNVIAACYRFHDLMLGRLLQLAGSETTVVIVSDHGFRSGDLRLKETIKTLEGLSRWHDPCGICVMHGPNVRPDTKINGASLLDVTPTILSLLNLPLGMDMDGRPWLEAINSQATPKCISSWDDIPGEAGLHPAELRQQPAESLEAIRHLIELGYIEAPDADVQQAIEMCLETNQFNLGRSLLEAGLASEAIAILEPLVEKRPRHEDYSNSLRGAYNSMTNWQRVRGAVESSQTSGSDQ